MKYAEIAEGFVSNLTNLSVKDIERAYQKEFGTSVKIAHAEFIKLEKGSKAVYKVASKDEETGEYIINDFYLSHYVQGGVKLDDVSPMPEEIFASKTEAVNYVKNNPKAKKALRK